MNMNMNFSKQIKKGILQAGFILIIATACHQVYAQPSHLVTGTIIGQENNEAIAFANVALFDSTGTYLISGAASDPEGIFSLINPVSGNYQIRISALGYESFKKQIAMNGKEVDLGIIYLPDLTMELDGVNVVAERLKAKPEAGKTTFYVNQRMHEASNTGTDILKLLPGIHVDLQQNISLEGSRNILVLVDGRERDRSYLSQLHAGKIDRIEIISNPPAKYDAGVTGVINIILVKEKNAGLDGHVFVEIPASSSEVLLVPAYSLNYGFGKINLFTSFNGDYRYFHIHESSHRKIFTGQERNEIISNQFVKQKTWSHRFHYGFDYFLNSRNQLNFYAFYNPWSQEHDGRVELQTNGGMYNWQAEKEDDDKNRSGFYSLYFKHIFDETSGHVLDLDAGWYNLNTENTTTYVNQETGYFHENKTMPQFNTVNLKLDYTLPLNEKIKINSGAQTRMRLMKDRAVSEFQYSENIHAAFGAVHYSTPSITAHIGIRLENTETKLNDNVSGSYLELLPNVSFNYHISPAQSLKLGYRRSLSYPAFYLLNPVISQEDPFTFYTGNANLVPEMHNETYMEYAQRFGNQFLSARLFYQHTSDAIRNLMQLNESGMFEIRRYNLGDIQQYGIQLSGALSFASRAGINPYLKIMDVHSVPNHHSPEFIESRNKMAFESGFSAYASFKYGITASAILRYSSPLNEIQGTSFSGALYFVSLEKAFAKGMKAGVVSALPFAKTFTYQGSRTSAPDFESYSKGEIQMSAVPFWFRFTWQFSSGGKREKIERSKMEFERENKKGF
jgi:hypothetical protein